MWEPIAKRLGFDKPERHQIRFLILNHLRANAYEPGWTDAAVRRFDHEMGEHLDHLLELSCADVTSRRPGRREEAIRNIEALRQRILAIRVLDARVPPLPAGLGNAIMEAFAIPPSKRIGELRKLCEDAIERGELEERREADYYIAYLRKSGAVWRPTRLEHPTIETGTARRQPAAAAVAASAAAFASLWSRAAGASVSNVDSTTPSRSFVMSRRWFVSARRSSSRRRHRTLVDVSNAGRRNRTLAHLLADALQDSIVMSEPAIDVSFHGSTRCESVPTARLADRAGLMPARYRPTSAAGRK